MLPRTGTADRPDNFRPRAGLANTEVERKRPAVPATQDALSTATLRRAGRPCSRQRSDKPARPSGASAVASWREHQPGPARCLTRCRLALPRRARRRAGPATLTPTRGELVGVGGGAERRSDLEGSGNSDTGVVKTQVGCVFVDHRVCAVALDCPPAGTKAGAKKQKTRRSRRRGGSGHLRQRPLTAAPAVMVTARCTPLVEPHGPRTDN